MVRHGANIQRTGSSPNYSYSVAADWANRPVNYVSFWDAARFANWLHNGQPTGPQGPGTTEDGAYHDVGNQTLFGRNAGAKFFIPTEDEWYKAAYHDKNAGLAASYFDYPTAIEHRADQHAARSGEPRQFLRLLSAPGTTATQSAAPTIARKWAHLRTRPAPTARSIKAATCGSGTKRLLFSSSRGLRGGSFSDNSVNLRASYRNDHRSHGRGQQCGVPRGKYS